MMTNIKTEDYKSGSTYKSLIVALFDENVTLVVGGLASAFAILATAIISGSWALYGLAACATLVCVLRYLMGRKFGAERASSELTLKNAQKWELHFSIGAALYGAILGIWCLICGVLDNEFLRFVSVTTTLANMVGISSRSFAIKRLVDMQLVSISVPMVVGLYLTGGAYAVFGVLLVPFMFSVRKVAERQRNVLLSHIHSRKKAVHLATQFNTALNNIPQGMCMFGADDRLEVANSHIMRILGKDWNSIKGITHTHLLDMMVDRLDVNSVEAAALREWQTSIDGRCFTTSFQMGKAPRKTVKLRAARMENGGSIVTFEDITKEVLANDRIDHMTRFDRLTGLINRSYLPSLIRNQLEVVTGEEKCAVLVMNIKRFKHINDTLGHHFGDVLLCKVADRMKDVVGDAGGCARVSSDEFAIVLRDEDCEDLVAHVADTLLEEMAKPFEIDRRVANIECIIGVALQEDENTTPDLLLKHADLALLWAKKEGSSGWQTFSNDMSHELRKRRILENDLRTALNEGQFDLHFQPIVNAAKQGVTVCEALMRWNHPRKGPISPAVFIPVAEEIGLIREMGQWVLREACLRCTSWPGDTGVAVNLSALQFKQGDIVDTVRIALRESGLSPKRLELEVTESLMMEDVGDTVRKLTAFKDMGVRIALDDFGTGYSSLSYVNTLPLDKLKIDRSFVTDLKDDTKALTLVQGVSALGRELGMTIVVEGVETSDELDLLLCNTSVEEIQGYYFSKPVSSSAIRKILTPGSEENKALISKLPKGKPSLVA